MEIHIASSQPCVCSGMHVNCDPGTCSKAYNVNVVSTVEHIGELEFAGLEDPYWAMNTTLRYIKEATDGGCQTCRILFLGFLALERSHSFANYIIQSCTKDGSDWRPEEADHAGLNGFIDEEANLRGDGDAVFALDAMNKYTWIPESLQTISVKVHLSTGHVVFTQRNSIPSFYHFYRKATAGPTNCLSFPQQQKQNRLRFFDTENVECYQQIRQWMQDCEQHNNCPRNFGTIPKRLIDLGESGTFHPGQPVRLIETDQSHGQYLTLSHCWGQVPIITTTKANLTAMTTGIQWSELSKTFKDAMTITNAIGFRYIWIDSLCIIQDDPQDWAAESKKMHDIYRCSYATISADHAEDGTKGCFSKTLNVSKHMQRPEIKIHDENTITYCIPQLRHTTFSFYGNDRWGESRVSTRGWMLQERMLATRVLHYTTHELVWECNQILDCQCGQARLQEKNETLKIATWSCLNQGHSLQELLGHWRFLVLNYTKRELSKDTDRLIAFQGIETRFQIASAGAIISGIWTKAFPETMLWLRNQHTSKRSRRPLDYVAPSWSWGSITGRVDIPLLGHPSKSNDRQFPISWLPFADDFNSRSLAQVEKLRGSLTISGQVIQRRLTIDTSLDPDHDINWSTARYQLTNPDDFSNCEFRPDAPMEANDAGSGLTVTCVLWSKVEDEHLEDLPDWSMLASRDRWEEFSYILVLRESLDHANCYTRLGVATLFWSRRYPNHWPQPAKHLSLISGFKAEKFQAAIAKDWFKDAHVRDITII